MIAILQGAPVFGAIERHYVVHIVEGLRREGAEEIALLYPDVPELAPLAGLAGANVRAVPFAYSASAPRVVWTVARELRRLRPRLVHVPDVWPAGMLAAWLARVPRRIVTHHTVELPRRDNLLGRALWRLAWATRPEVVYISETNRRKDGRASLTTSAMDYGIDVARYAAGTPSLPKEGPLVGAICRLAEQKGLRYLVEAAPVVLARHPRTRFAIVGEGELRGGLERQVRDADLEDAFLFTGARDDVPDVLASLDVFVLPSLFEGLPHSVLEAQAAGVPVVGTPSGGTEEVVITGETGILVPIGDARALAAGIVALLDDPEEAARLAAEAKRRVHERYTVEHLAEQARALYGPS